MRKWIRTVGELREQLKHLDDDLEFVVKHEKKTLMVDGVRAWEEGAVIYCRDVDIFLKEYDDAKSN